MPRKEDIPPPGPPLAPPPSATKALKGLAGKLAAAVNRHADAFIDEAADPRGVDAAMRTVAAIARAALALQQLQASEERADERVAARQAACNRAILRAFGPIHDEGDETDMNATERDLEDPDVMAAIYQKLGRGLGEAARHLEAKCGVVGPAEGHGGAAERSLDDGQPPLSEAARH